MIFDLMILSSLLRYFQSMNKILKIKVNIAKCLKIEAAICKVIHKLKGIKV